jgi:hypothetical protein
VQFDEGEFMKRYLTDSLPIQMVDQFNVRLAVVQSLLSSDVRCRIRGRDFIKIFTWYLRTIEKRKYLTEDSVRQMLYMALRPEELTACPMFSQLLTRLIQLGEASGA